MASPRRNNKGVKKLRKILRDKKAISTILAALLMVVIVVVASVMVYAWSTGLLGALMGTNPNIGQETLTLDTATLSSNSSVFVLNLRNQGKVAVALTGYYVANAGSTSTYQKLSGWTGPTINVGQVGTAYIRLDNGGTWTGNSFTFQTGFTYGVKLQTANTLLPEVAVPK